MYQSLLSGNPVEADQILGDLLLRGRSAHVATPILEAAYTHLFAYLNRSSLKARIVSGELSGHGTHYANCKGRHKWA
jgi:hypothetical protein